MSLLTELKIHLGKYSTNMPRLRRWKSWWFPFRTLRMTVLEAIQKSTEFLTKKGVESPRLQTELLLAHLLKLPRMKLYLNFEPRACPAEVDGLREFIKPPWSARTTPAHHRLNFVLRTGNRRQPPRARSPARNRTARRIRLAVS